MESSPVDWETFSENSPPPPPPDPNSIFPSPSVTKDCPFNPSCVGKVNPEIVVIPVVFKNSVSIEFTFKLLLGCCNLLISTIELSGMVPVVSVSIITAGEVVVTVEIDTVDPTDITSDIVFPTPINTASATGNTGSVIRTVVPVDNATPTGDPNSIAGASVLISVIETDEPSGIKIVVAVPTTIVSVVNPTTVLEIWISPTVSITNSNPDPVPPTSPLYTSKLSFTL